MGLYAGGKHLSYGYSGFQSVRLAIGKALGYEDYRKELRDKFTDYALMGFWIDPEETWVLAPAEEPEDDIEYLLLHQDCAGILLPWTSRRIAARLRDVIAHIPDDSVWPTFNTRLQTIELLDFLDYAGENGYIVEFA